MGTPWKQVLEKFLEVNTRDTRGVETVWADEEIYVWLVQRRQRAQGLDEISLFFELELLDKEVDETVIEVFASSKTGITWP